MTKRVLEDYETAPIDEKLRAMLGLLETFTLNPEQMKLYEAAEERRAERYDRFLAIWDKRK